MKKLLIVAATTGILLLTGCSKDGKDFKESAESFIESSQVEDQVGHTFTGTVCTEPAKIEAGETFTCSATDETGVTWDFDAIVRSEDSFEVVLATPRP